MTDQTRYPATPRWVKWLGALAFLAAASIALLHLTGHGFSHAHGPGLDPSRPPGDQQS